MAEEEPREEIEEIVDNGEPIEEAVIETIIEEEDKPKPKSKPKTRAKPNIKITKEPVEEAIVEEPIIEEQPAPVKVYKFNKIVQCPGCGLGTAQHTLLYIHKRRGLCKAVKAEPEKNTRTRTNKANYRRYCK